MSGYCEQEKVVRAYSCCDVHSTWDRWCEYTCAVGIMFDINFPSLPYLLLLLVELLCAWQTREVQWRGAPSTCGDKNQEL